MAEILSPQELKEAIKGKTATKSSQDYSPAQLREAVTGKTPSIAEGGSFTAPKETFAPFSVTAGDNKPLSFQSTQNQGIKTTTPSMIDAPSPSEVALKSTLKFLNPLRPAEVRAPLSTEKQTLPYGGGLTEIAGSVVNTIYDIIPRGAVTAFDGFISATESITGQEPGSIKIDPGLGVDMRRFGYDQPKYVRAYEEAANKISEGQDPLSTILGVTSSKSLDILFGAQMAQAILGEVVASLGKKGSAQQISAWEKLGKPKTTDELKYNYRKFAAKTHPDKYGVKSDTAFKELNTAKQVLDANGIPKGSSRIANEASRLIEPLTRNTNVNPLNTFVSRLAKPNIAPAPRSVASETIAGLLPGQRPQGGVAQQKAGLSAQPVESVGGASPLGKQGSAGRTANEIIKAQIETGKKVLTDPDMASIVNADLKGFLKGRQDDIVRALNKDGLNAIGNTIAKIDVSKLSSLDQLSGAISSAFQGAVSASKIVEPAVLRTLQKAILEGDIAVRSKDGANVYEVKTSAGKEVVKTPSEAVGLIKNAKEEARILKEIQQDTLSDSPAKTLNKHFGKSSDTISQQLENAKGTKRATFIQDTVSELGYADTDAAQKALDSYKASRDEIANSKFREGAAKAEIKAQERAIAKKESLAKSQVETPTENPRGEVSVPKNDKLESVSSQETIVLENLALESQAIQDRLGGQDAYSLPEIIQESISPVKKTGTPVEKKVNIIDYFRTPDRVLSKIGLAKEGDFLRQQYEGYLKELPKNIDKISAWAETVPGEEASRNIFKWLDGYPVELTSAELRVANEIKDWLSKWADRLGLPEDKRIANYITHIFEDQLIAKEFDEDLAKIISDRIPGSVYNPFLLERLGAKGFKEDVWDALDAYVKRATRKVYLDPALERLQRAGSKLEESQWKYIQRYTNRVNLRPTELDNILDNTVKSIIGGRLGQRPVARVTKLLRQWTYRAMLGLNLSSSLRNLSQGINTYAKLGEKYTAIGYARLFEKGAMEELKREGVLEAGFVQDRALSAKKKLLEQADKGLFLFFETAERINRGSAYFGMKSKMIAEGKTEAQAIKEAKKLVRDTQFAFGSIDTPVVLSSDLVKTLLQFQSFTTKQIEFLTEMAKDKDFAGLLRYALAGILFVATIGKLFGMDYKELLPMYRFGTPPSLGFPAAVGSAALDLPDKYGNPRTSAEKGLDIAKSSLGLIPAGSQIKKTYQGIQAINQGGSFDNGGNFQFEVGTTLAQKAQAIAFGKYASKNAKDYFDRQEKAAEKTEAVQPVYDKIQKLKEEGKDDEALSLYNDLSDDQKDTYKKIKSAAKSKETLQLQKDTLPVYQKIQKLKSAGNDEEALATYNALSDDQKKAYKSIKKKIGEDQKAADGEKPSFESGPATDRSVISTVLTYAEAIGVDPVTAFNRIFSGEVIRRVDNGTVIVDRLSLDKSQAIKEDRNGNNTTVKLDHTIPLQLGGSNSEKNLILVPTEIWESYTPIENFLGGLLRKDEITKGQAQNTIKDFKEGKITADEVYEKFNNSGKIK